MEDDDRTDADGSTSHLSGVPDGDPGNVATWRSGLVFLAGGLGFVGSAVAFLGAVVIGGDVGWPVAINAAAALVVIAWVARRAYADPDSDVTTIPGVFGTALLLVAAYAVVAAVVVALASPFHSRLGLAIWLGSAGVVAAVLGVATFPLEVVFDAGEDGDGNRPDSEATGSGDRS